GEVYNICSGKDYSIKQILDILLSLTKVKIEIKQDPKRMRPSDVPVLRGDNTKFCKKTGWKPEIPFEQMKKIGFSLLGITETPLVIAEVQRPGPATGLPTWTEQGDLHFVIRSGHGEFPKIVLAPGDVLEAYRLTQEAFNLADIYQCPVFILSDKYLAEGFKSVEKSKIQNSKTQINRGKVIDNLQYKEGELVEFQRYIVTEDGISPRLVPGTKGAYFQANSYSHIADGHTTEEAESRKKQVDKLLKKTETYKKSHLPPPVLYGNPEAPLTIVSWGSMKGPVLQAMQDLPEFNLLHFTYIYPFSPQAESILRKAKKLLLLENNATGQLGELIAQETGIRIENKLLKYDGRPFYPEEVIEGIKSYL
ncbi:MAG: Pyruvate flavodoxin/ferredoxin oxidoreductase domain protein, partial [Candidatus Gottesmanbacteria bacterium GW2011_GWC2_39_8]